MKRSHIPQEDLSTLFYLWREYDRAPRALAFRAQTPEEWRVWRDALRVQLIELLGGFPTERGDLAPRPLLIKSGIADPIFPMAGVKPAYAEIARVYAVLNCPDHLAVDFFPGGHRVGRRKAFAWLERWLYGRSIL
jgi:hypothetical protein